MTTVPTAPRSISARQRGIIEFFDGTSALGDPLDAIEARLRQKDPRGLLGLRLRHLDAILRNLFQEMGLILPQDKVSRTMASLEGRLTTGPVREVVLPAELIQLQLAVSRSGKDGTLIMVSTCLRLIAEIKAKRAVPVQGG